MKIIFSEKCLEYGWPGHIEGPERVKKAFEFLKKKYEFLEPKPASVEDLLKVHGKEYVDLIKNARAGSYLDGDTPVPENIYEYAKLSAGGAILAAREKGFSLMRPPGHHAGRNGKALGAATLGFCYFNNIAVAVRSSGDFLGRSKSYVHFIASISSLSRNWPQVSGQLFKFSVILPCRRFFVPKNLGQSIESSEYENY
jgi:acetoin utilization deacetylase AcuC-like enzyme